MPLLRGFNPIFALCVALVCVVPMLGCRTVSIDNVSLFSSEPAGLERDFEPVAINYQPIGRSDFRSRIEIDLGETAYTTLLSGYAETAMQRPGFIELSVYAVGVQTEGQVDGKKLEVNETFDPIRMFRFVVRSDGTLHSLELPFQELDASTDLGSISEQRELALALAAQSLGEFSWALQPRLRGIVRVGTPLFPTDSKQLLEEIRTVGLPALERSPGFDSYLKKHNVTATELSEQLMDWWRDAGFRNDVKVKGVLQRSRTQYLFASGSYSYSKRFFGAQELPLYDMSFVGEVEALVDPDTGIVRLIDIALDAEMEFVRKMGLPSDRLEGRFGLQWEINTDDWQTSRLASATPAPGPNLPPVTADSEAPTIDAPRYIRAVDDAVQIDGRVSDASTVARLSVGGRPVPLRSDGAFSVTRYVPPDGEVLEIEAIDEWNNRSKHVVRVERSAGGITPPVTYAALDPTVLPKRDDRDAIALVFGIAKYTRTADAEFADRDAEVFADYARRVWGVGDDDLQMLINDEATLAESIIAIKSWLRSRIQPGKTHLIVYFAGHGLADPGSDELYLLPSDASPSLLGDTALTLQTVFNVIEETRPETATLFLDTCFSGISRGRETLVASARPVVLVHSDLAPPDSTVIISAASGSQFSGGMPQVRHGLFTYFLLKGFEGDADLDGDKEISVGELQAYVSENVIREAARMGREQTPQVIGDQDQILFRLD